MKPDQNTLPVPRTGAESSASDSDTDAALTMFAELLLEIALEEQKRKKRLEIEPNGFILEGGYTCCICHHGYRDIWYDKHGMKCLDCQNAIDKKIIPVSACKNDDDKVFFTSYNLQYDLNLHSATIRKLIRQERLVPRNIPYRDGSGTYFQIFLKKENAPFLQSLIKVKTKDGTTVRLPQNPE